MRQPPRQLPLIDPRGNLGATADLAVSPGREVWTTGTLNANCAITTRGDVAGAMFYLLLTQGAGFTVSINGTSIPVPQAAGATITVVGRYGAAWDLQVMLGVDAVDLALAAGGLLPMVSGRYMDGPLLSTFQPSNGDLRLGVLTIPVPTVLAGLTVDFSIAGEAASLFAPVLYNDDGTGYPSTVLASGATVSTGTGNAGTVATGGTPGKYFATFPSNQALAAGRYWIGGATQGAPTTLPTLRTGPFQTRAVARSSLVAGENPVGWHTTGWTSGAAPSFVGLAQSSTSNLPRVGIKIA